MKRGKNEDGIDFSKITTYSLTDRKNLVTIENMARPGQEDVPQWGGEDFQNLVERVKEAREQGRLRLRGLVHSDARFYLDDADARSVDSFLLRRVRPTVEATMYRLFDFKLMPDFGGGTTALQDAYMDARLHPKFKVRAYNRCPLCGRPRAFFRRFRMCRLCLRSLARKGQIPGLVKASW